MENSNDVAISTVAADPTDANESNESAGRTGFLRTIQRTKGRNQGSTNGPETEPKRSPGRPRKPRDEHGNIIRDDDGSGTEHASIRSGGNASDPTGARRDDNEQTSTVGKPEARITGSKSKPRNVRGKRGGGAIQPEHIERWMIQSFAIVAMMKNAPHWMIERPDVEVQPWSPSAAELMNKYMPSDVGDKMIAANAGIAVCVGISVMVTRRLEMDRQAAAQSRLVAARGNREQMQKSEGVPNADALRRNEEFAAQPQDTASPNGFIPGSGAAPVKPDPIPGFNSGRNPGAT